MARGASDRTLAWLKRVRDVCRAMASEVDRAGLLGRILEHAMAITLAERGFLVIVEPAPGGAARFEVREARGFDAALLSSEQGRFSRTLVREVLDRGRGLVADHHRGADPATITSLRNQDILSVLCAPMTLRGEVRGILYLDSRAPEAFSEADLPILATFADQAALTWEALSEEPGALAVGETGLIGESAAMRGLDAQLRRLARSWQPVLIRGEHGTGKELIARAIHGLSSRAGAPFLGVNCAALAPGLVEAELFGVARGAYSGADRDRPGLFQTAAEGTLFLDEVGDLPLALQPKLLRVLQEREVRPVGARAPVPVACRLLAATHQDLEALVARGRLREDLYYRLDVLRITAPPLRERPEDIPALCQAFAARHGRPGLRISARAMALLEGWRWPGNVRELENELRRLIALGQRDVSARQLSPHIREGRGLAPAPLELAGRTLDEVERAAIAHALEACDGEKARAARALGITRARLYRLLAKHGL